MNSTPKSPNQSTNMKNNNIENGDNEKQTTHQSRKRLKICCGIATIIVICLVIVIVTLFFTILKPKNPILSPYPTKLRNVNISLGDHPTVNATLDLIIAVRNPNRGRFEYSGSTAALEYRGVSLAEIPVDSGSVPSRGIVNVSIKADVSGGDKVVEDPRFLEDFSSGSVGFAAHAALPGKVRLLGLFKKHATVLMSCDVNVFTNQSYYVLSTCNAKLKL